MAWQRVTRSGHIQSQTKKATMAGEDFGFVNLRWGTQTGMDSRVLVRRGGEGLAYIQYAVNITTRSADRPRPNLLRKLERLPSISLQMSLTPGTLSPALGLPRSPPHTAPSQTSEHHLPPQQHPPSSATQPHQTSSPIWRRLGACLPPPRRQGGPGCVWAEAWHSRWLPPLPHSLPPAPM